MNVTPCVSLRTWQGQEAAPTCGQGSHPAHGAVVRGPAGVSLWGKLWHLDGLGRQQVAGVGLWFPSLSPARSPGSLCSPIWKLPTDGQPEMPGNTLLAH